MERILEIEKCILQAIKEAHHTQDLKQIEQQYLGKSGKLMLLMRELSQLPSDQRPLFGQKLNQTKQHIEQIFQDRFQEFKSKEQALQFASESIDITLPGQKPFTGRPHILYQTVLKVQKIFAGLGFEYLEFPELEHFNYNFSCLNYPPNHPAMDEQDTFYIDNDYLLRTQCTAFQGRILENQKPPLKIFTIGKCFRNEAVDRTHNHTFHQIDALVIDENISLAHLKGTLSLFTKAMFGPEVTVRFRPDFFPFVEPGVDYAISTPKFANGKWLELGGAGLIHPNILEKFGIDTERYTGWAFGLGLERIPMLAYGIDDLRAFLENDPRFLEQFPS